MNNLISCIKFTSYRGRQGVIKVVYSATLYQVFVPAVQFHGYDEVLNFKESIPSKHHIVRYE